MEDDLIDKVRKLLVKGEVEQVLSLVGEFLGDKSGKLSRQLYLIASRYNKNKSEYKLQLIDNDTYMTTSQQTVDVLLDLIDELESSNDIQVKSYNDQLYSRLNALFLIHSDITNYYKGVENQFKHVLESTQLNHSAASLLISSFNEQLSKLHDIKEKVIYLSKLKIADDSLQRQLLEWEEYLQNSFVINGFGKLVRIEESIDKIYKKVKNIQDKFEKSLESYHTLFNYFPNVNRELTSVLSIPISIIEGETLLQKLPEKIDSLNQLKTYIDDWSVSKEDLSDISFKLKLLNFIEEAQNATLDNIDDILELATDLQNEYSHKIEELKQNAYSREAINRYKEFGIDIGIVSEEKIDYINDLRIESYKHSFVVDHSNLWQKIELIGTNVSGEEISYTIFSADASVPTPFDKMDILAYDHIREKKLVYNSVDNDQSTSKELKVYFYRPIQAGEKFKISIEFKLYNTIMEKGKDYIISVTGYTESVDRYCMELSFKDNLVTHVQAIDLIRRYETMLYPENNIFRMELSDYPKLNELRLALFFHQ